MARQRQLTMKQGRAILCVGRQWEPSPVWENDDQLAAIFQQPLIAMYTTQILRALNFDQNSLNLLSELYDRDRRTL